MAVGSIKQMLNDFKNGTYNLTCNGKCTGCGECMTIAQRSTTTE